MLAITGYIAIDMPSLYSEFILPFQWSILHLPYPFSHPPVIRPPSRDLLSQDLVSQELVSRELLTFFEEGRVVHSDAHELFLGNLFFAVLVMVAPLVLFVFPVAILACCKRVFTDKYPFQIHWKM